MWCWQPDAGGSAYDLITKNGALTDFRLVAYKLHDYIEGYRAAHRGESLALNTPTMFFNKGNGTVEWVKPTQSHTYKLERSVNGGAWTTVTTSGATVDSVGRKYTYKDTALPASGTVQYRVTAISGGNTAVSYSNTVDILPPAVNLAQNGSFENGMNGWTLFGTSGNYRVTTATARSGSASLELDYGSFEWEGVYQMLYTVKPNTNYTLTYWYKHAADDTANNAYCFVRESDINGTNIIGQAYMNGGYSTEWKQETIQFRTGDTTTLCIDFRVVAGTHTYVDDVELYEAQ